MIKIKFLSGNSRIYSYTNMPILASKMLFYDKGYDVELLKSINNKKLNCDILIILSKYLFNKLNETERILTENSNTIQFIQKCKQSCNKIVWFDNSDSTSITHFELMPYIDIYLKKQIFKDKSNYRKKLIGGRLFTNYYHEKYNINYEGNFSELYPLLTTDEDKLKLGWNIGLGDVINSFGKITTLYNKYFPSKNYERLSNPTPIDINRGLDIFLKTTENLSEEIISFHRKKMIDELNKIVIGRNLNSIIQGEKLPKKEFIDNMKNTKIMPSPFGWGELGARDYEAFYYGACLFKPEMSHMLTWPDIFVKDETYVPINWNFSDLEEKIVYYLGNNKIRKTIAMNGQKLYLESFSKKGLENFSNHFISQLS